MPPANQAKDETKPRPSSNGRASRVIAVGKVEFVFFTYGSSVGLSVRTESREIEVPMTREQASTLGDVFKMIFRQQ